MIVDLIIATLALIFWLVPSLLATWMFWRILKFEILNDLDYDIRTDGLTVEHLIGISVFIVLIIFVLLFCWIPLVNLGVMSLILANHDNEIFKLGEIYIIKPQKKVDAKHKQNCQEE